jgi:hypothetical protein
MKKSIIVASAILSIIGVSAMAHCGACGPKKAAKKRRRTHDSAPTRSCHSKVTEVLASAKKTVTAGDKQAIEGEEPHGGWVGS